MARRAVPRLECRSNTDFGGFYSPIATLRTGGTEGSADANGLADEVSLSRIYSEVFRDDVDSLPRPHELMPTTLRQLSTLLSESYFFMPSTIPLLDLAFQRFAKSDYYTFFVATVPLLEHALRRAYVCIHELNESRFFTADSVVQYLTLDVLLAPHAVDEGADGKRRNRLLDVLGVPTMELLLDIFSAMSGPRLRDRLSHGEANNVIIRDERRCCGSPVELDESLARVYLALLIALAVDFRRDGIKQKCEGAIRQCVDFVHSYRSRFHPLAMVHAELAKAAVDVWTSLRSLCELWEAATEDEHREHDTFSENRSSNLAEGLDTQSTDDFWLPDKLSESFVDSLDKLPTIVDPQHTAPLFNPHHIPTTFLHHTSPLRLVTSIQSIFPSPPPLLLHSSTKLAPHLLRLAQSTRSVLRALSTRMSNMATSVHTESCTARSRNAASVLANKGAGCTIISVLVCVLGVVECLLYGGGLREPIGGKKKRANQSVWALGQIGTLVDRVTAFVREGHFRDVEGEFLGVVGLIGGKQ
ncbi:hypothetical protein HK104_010355 [Borealophlyctis nickersoniae]|nr:hypothetical protein HK104_010355 [Borealophlyctis nickersoniae]